MRNFQLAGRSPVIAENGVVATSHPLASATALNILMSGGNAVDAAIAASAVLSVVEPHMTGIGGDCFAIVSEPDGTIHGLNGSGRAAKNSHLDWYLERNMRSFDQFSPHSVTVPGSIKAWETLHQRFGSFDFCRLFENAINYAENGYGVAARVARDWAGQVDSLRKDEGAAKHFLLKGQAPITGEKMHAPALAGVLRDIAKNGADAFYKGSIAAEIAEVVQAKGGFLSEEDLANVSVDWVELIGTDFSDHRLLEIPPNGQGIIALIIANLIEFLGTKDLPHDSAERYHLEIEAGRVAYSIRDAWLCDPAVMPVSVDDLLSKEFTEMLAKQISLSSRNNALKLPEIPRSGTVYLTVADRDGRMVSFINSIFGSFGSQIVTPDSGIALQNRGSSFVNEAGHPNAIGPSKRPMHTIIPAMATKNNKAAISFGVMGGAYQPMGHAHVLSNMLDFNMDPQEAIDHGRIFWAPDGVLEYEDSIADAVALGLKAKGHQVRKAVNPWGGGQIIRANWDEGFYTAGSESRKDGCAIGY